MDVISIAPIQESCELCGQSVNGDRPRVESSELALFGAARYACCPRCLRSVPRPWSAEYRSQWDAAFRTHAEVNGAEAVDTGSPHVGRPLKNDHGTHARFHLALEGRQYVLALHISEQVVPIGSFETLNEAMASWKDFRYRLLDGGFRECAN